MFDLFSSKADNYNADSAIKAIDTNINRFDGKGYGIKYLLDCLKVDNEEYYKSITKKDMIIDGSNDDIGASEIVINYYKKSLIICKGVLYVNDNNVWICGDKQVDKLLIDMIGKLDIMFYGADGKRKYHYNKSIKHIKDCIVCIKANKTIINDKFYDDMIKNNKYYLPFNDGIYSFKDKKLYSYDELPNIHFTYKINRNFPKYNKEDYDDLMDKVIIPIYPDETERKYNAHIKSRALAGCYEDKKWYGYSGSRNSGKGTETGILRSAFGDFVLEFNAKCLIYKKIGNPEAAKGLSWVVDKKDATCAFGRGSDLGGHAQARVAGHDAVRCRWGSNPAGPPTGRHCVPNSGRRCMRLTPWYCPSLLGVQEELVVVAATYSSPAYWSTLGLCTIGPVGVWRASTREGKARPGEAAVAGVM